MTVSARGLLQRHLHARAYHHLTEPERLMEPFSALRPGGEIAIQDFRPSLLTQAMDTGWDTCQSWRRRVPPEIVTRELSNAGFGWPKLSIPGSELVLF